MVNLYTSYELVKQKFQGVEIIRNNDEYFKRMVDYRKFDGIDYKILKHIDNVIRDDMGVLLSPFGDVAPERLSTGCKTVINLYHSIRDKANVIIDLTQCGENALNIAFKMLDITNGSKAILRHGEISNSNTIKLPFMVNDDDNVLNIKQAKGKIINETCREGLK